MQDWPEELKLKEAFVKALREHPHNQEPFFRWMHFFQVREFSMSDAADEIQQGTWSPTGEQLFLYLRDQALSHDETPEQTLNRLVTERAALRPA